MDTFFFLGVGFLAGAAELFINIHVLLLGEGHGVVEIKSSGENLGEGSGGRTFIVDGRGSLGGLSDTDDFSRGWSGRFWFNHDHGVCGDDG